MGCRQRPRHDFLIHPNSMDSVSLYNQYYAEYDRWFDEHPVLFESELKALEKVVPQNGFGVEIGVGTGRFAERFSITQGLDPSEEMARIAEERGIKTRIGKAESMPFSDNMFDYAVMITVDCFLESLPEAFQEVGRVLKPGGELITGMIDKNSRLGKIYQKKKNENPFYKHAIFHSPDEITAILKKSRFESFEYWQTLVSDYGAKIETPKPGYGRGGFVVFKALNKQQ